MYDASEKERRAAIQADPNLAGCINLTFLETERREEANADRKTETLGSLIRSFTHIFTKRRYVVFSERLKMSFTILFEVDMYYLIYCANVYSTGSMPPINVDAQ